MPLKRYLSLTLALTCSGCLFDTQKTKTDTSPLSLRGSFVLGNGKPAAHAKVYFYPVDFHPRAAAPKSAAVAIAPDSTEADPEGTFSIALQEGEYNVLAELDSLRAFRDSVRVTEQGTRLAPATLKPVGGVRGTLSVQPNHSPRAAFVELVGTAFFGNVDDSGEFDLEGIPEGAYTLAALTSLPDYTPAFRSVSVRSGATQVLDRTVELAFTGIPVVAGAKVAYDTAAGIVRLTWNPSSYFAIKDYLVYRDSAGATAPSAALASTHDTLFLDTIYRNGWPSAFAGHPDSLPLELSYHVRVRSKSDSMGSAFESASIRAVPPDWITTRIGMRTLGTRGDSGRAGDTVRVIASFRNRIRKIASIAWSIETGGKSVRVIRLDAREGEDTLAWSWTTPSRPWVHVEVRDEGGETRTDSLRLNLIADAPQAIAGGDTLASIRGSLRLTADARLRFGRITKWDWDIGNTGTFHPGKDTLITAPSFPDSQFLCILRATDDLGQVGLDTLRVRIVPWARLADAPCHGVSPFGYAAVGPSRAVEDGKLYSLCEVQANGRASVRMLEFDPATGKWAAKATAPDAGVDVPMFYLRNIGGILYLPNPENLFAYDPRTDKWSVKAAPPTARTYNREIGIPSAVVNGKLYLAGGNALGGREGSPTGNLDIYDPATNTWKRGAQLPIPVADGMPNWGAQYSVAAAGDRLLLYYNTLSRSSTAQRYTYLYDAVGDSWETIDSSSSRNGVSPPQAEAAGKLYLRNESEAFDVALRKWVPNGFPAGGLPYAQDMASLGGSVFSLVSEPAAEPPGERPQPPWTTSIVSWDPGSAAWNALIPIVSDVNGLSMVPIGNRLFLFTGDTEVPMETFEYYLP